MASQQQNILHSPTSLLRSWNFWLRLLGVGLALGCGLAIVPIINEGFAILILFLVGIVSACLLRSWGAVLIVPAVFSVGAILVAAILAVGAGGFENLAIGWGVLAAFIVIVGAVIGTPIGMSWKKRQPL